VPVVIFVAVGLGKITTGVAVAGILVWVTVAIRLGLRMITTGIVVED
jgi:hypothetical protein